MDDGKKDLQVSAHRDHLADGNPDGNRYKETTVFEKERMIDEKAVHHTRVSGLDVTIDGHWCPSSLAL
ncbi:hypothetical protein I314_06240 [Cryptococcus bacillisporus CA1873]|uniref:Uncharacterized protein n=1 Tax=Cryptococcus bacillisporus CA1873 TaxID=1296111 RepID=A0ABR5B310_CRYGA|nr:hypothetical protein I314_06240 [Cryptococcus bacillisporus CA1873]|eukprot:KIR57978.1 hypothetical protein I314_06240 [Cryptococcus gattii CA1873]